VIRHSAVMLLLYVALIGSAGWLIVTTAARFHSRAGSRLRHHNRRSCRARRRWRATTDIVRQIEKTALDTPGVIRVAGICRLLGARPRTQAGNAAALFPVFEEPEVRLKKGAHRGGDHCRFAQAPVGDSGGIHHRHFRRHRCRVSAPAAVSRCASRDRQGRGPELLAAANDETCRRGAPRRPGLTQVFSPFTANHAAAVRRYRSGQGAENSACRLRTSTKPSRPIFGSTYVNDFNLFGRTYHVTATGRPAVSEGEVPIWRGCAPRNAAGDMVMLGSVVEFPRRFPAPTASRATTSIRRRSCRAKRYRARVSATAINTMKKLAEETLPSGFLLRMDRPFVPAGHRRQCRPLCVPDLRAVRVPGAGRAIRQLEACHFAVILIVPMCLLAATLGVRIMGQDVNILTQIGFVVLVGLAAKNAILIVEFARDISNLRATSVSTPVIEACRLRLRPILMTFVRIHPRCVAAGGFHPARDRKCVRRSASPCSFGMLGGDAVRAYLYADLLYYRSRTLADRWSSKKAGRSRIIRDIAGSRSRASILLAYLKYMGSRRVTKYHAQAGKDHAQNESFRETNMKSRLLSAALCGMRRFTCSSGNRHRVSRSAF